MITLSNVSYAYEGNAALCGIDIDIPRGSSVAFIGPNGSGKSTLLKLLNGIVLPDAGRYSFDGELVTRDALRNQAFVRRFHKRIGFLFQNSEAQLFCPSVKEEVAFGPRQMGLDEREVADRTNDCLELLDIARLAQRSPWHLSEGEKRKVAFASVLALNPEVLALDEPLNGLDPRTKCFLRELVVSLRDAGKTILCATHDFHYVEGVFSDAVVFSADHRIVRTGGLEEIVADRGFLEANNLL
ncbi:MAG TPA: ABC transporter ATP-binding protein [Spirochaetia bacterium]|nr:ABC transporter ATP-binding protein [Spirochaetia bacterium]